jgi:fructose/tagatose bisphosphate aldolase
VIAGSPLPILLHLDHPDGMPMLVRCLQLGYRSVMFDGGALSLAENIAASKQAAEIGHAVGATVEAELGQFGGEHQAGTVMEANPEDCERLMKETGVDMLAVSAGSIHGQKSRLNRSLLRDIAKRVQRPLVLHGGSGIPREDTDLALQEGVIKINIGAAIFDAWIAGLREGLDGSDKTHTNLCTTRSPAKG